MGSIEVFPRRPGIALHEGWRAKPLAAGAPVRVREARLEDYAAVRALQRIAAPQRSPCTLKQLESQIHVFPRGQMVAVSDGELVGTASALILRWNDFLAERTRDALTGDRFLGPHDESGLTLFGTELVVDPTPRGMAAARALSQARRRLCRRMNLKRVLTPAMLEGYGRMRAELTPEAFAMRVVCGDIMHAPMRQLMAHGFQFCGVLRDYCAEDADAAGHAALFAWINTFYAPPRPPAFEESERARKCA
jgi:GNAT superfamily N-acetyltransferase